MKDPSRARVRGPLAPYAQGFVAELSRLGYTPLSATFQMQVMAHLSRWLEAEQLEVAALEPVTMAAFLAARRAEGYTGYLSAKALAPLLEYLRGLGVVPAAEAPALSTAELLLQRYRDHLIVERGLTAGTARGYVDQVRPIVASRMVNGGGELDLAGLMASEVLDFVLAECR